MRNDITIDRKQVRLPNIHLFGGNKWKAQFGDIVFFREGDRVLVGRVAGRVASGRDLTSNESLRDYLVVIALGSTMDFRMERWIAPKDVVDCYAPERLALAEKLAFFFSDQFKKHSTQELRQWANSGTTNP